MTECATAFRPAIGSFCTAAAVRLLTRRTVGPGSETPDYERLHSPPAMFFFFLPLGTDAPIYHRPWVTWGLIAAYALVFLATWPLAEKLGLPDFETTGMRFGVEVGDGLHPMQWLTYHFLHLGWAHFIGNMVFLWSFGLVVEGKIGNLRFAAVYFAVQALGAAIVQTAFLGDGYNFVVGASLGITGLMAACLIWAPKNELYVGYMYWLLFRARAGVAEMTLQTFLTLYLMIDVVIVAFMPTVLTSAMLHVCGLVLGLIYAIVAVKRDWVDCERWDIFSVIAGKHGTQLKRSAYEELDTSLGPSEAVKKKLRRRKEKARREKEIDPFAPPDSTATVGDSGGSATETLEAKARTLIRAGKPRAAARLIEQRRRAEPSFSVPRAELLLLAKGLHKAGKSKACLDYLAEYLKRYPTGSDRVRLLAADLLLKEHDRPATAQKILSKVDKTELSEADRATYRKLVNRCEERLESGVLELRDDAFE